MIFDGAQMHYAQDLFWQSIILVASVSSLPLLCAMSAGLLVGVLQAATQVQEQTLSFLVKLLVVSAILIAANRTIIDQFLEFSRVSLQQIVEISDGA